jgi:hypothetical protein
MGLLLYVTCAVQDREGIRAFLTDAEATKAQFIIAMASNEPDTCVMGLAEVCDVDDECQLIMQGDNGECRGLYGLMQHGDSFIHPASCIAPFLSS